MDPDGKSKTTSNRSSNTTSPSPLLSMTSSSASEGVVLDQDDLPDHNTTDSTSNAGFDFDSSEYNTADNDSEYEGEGEVHSVDGLVLMGSTRLRPSAPETSMNIVSKQLLYTQTFRQLFSRQDCTPAILPLALHGNLTNNFRSLCWRVFLNVLPSNSQLWGGSIRAVRENYKFLVDKFHTSQRLQDSSIDLTINNPLSQAEDSPWNQHFRDTELRREVEQDVVRVFPDHEFFQSAKIKEILGNVLFHYARCHPDLGYRQGMHELAAPLLYVIKCDCDTYTALRASLASDPATSGSLADLDNNVPRALLDEAWVEADTYSLFEALMEGQLSDWYRTSGHGGAAGAGAGPGRPWSRPQDARSGNLLVATLTNIHDVLLKRHDPALYARLEKLEIFPQLYGIRWLRLLFGREFQFRDTLTLWDAILADSCPPALCDQLVVALLMALRDLLLRYDYQDAVQLLMKLPSNLSVHYATQFALHLKDPIRFPKPTGSAFTAGYSRGYHRKHHRDLNVKAKKMVNMARNGERETDVQMRKKKAQAESRPESLKFTNQMQKSNLYRAYSLRDDTNSDFTVLDLHKDEEEGFQNIGTDGNPVRTEGESAPCSRDLQSKPSSTSSDNPSNSSHRDAIDNNCHHSLETTVAKLDSLLQQEPNLAHRSEIFRYMDTIKSMVGKPATVANPPCQNGNGNEMQARKGKRREKNRTTSLAVDVASYFKVEMDQ